MSSLTFPIPTVNQVPAPTSVLFIYIRCAKSNHALVDIHVKVTDFTAAFPQSRDWWDCQVKESFVWFKRELAASRVFKNSTPTIEVVSSNGSIGWFLVWEVAFFSNALVLRHSVHAGLQGVSDEGTVQNSVATQTDLTPLTMCIIWHKQLRTRIKRQEVFWHCYLHLSQSKPGAVKTSSNSDGSNC